MTKYIIARNCKITLRFIFIRRKPPLSQWEGLARLCEGAVDCRRAGGGGTGRGGAGSGAGRGGAGTAEAGVVGGAGGGAVSTSHTHPVHLALQPVAAPAVVTDVVAGVETVQGGVPVGYLAAPDLASLCPGQLAVVAGAGGEEVAGEGGRAREARDLLPPGLPAG